MGQLPQPRVLSKDYNRYKDKSRRQNTTYRRSRTPKGSRPGYFWRSNLSQCMRLCEDRSTSRGPRILETSSLFARSRVGKHIKKSRNLSFSSIVALETGFSWKAHASPSQTNNSARRGIGMSRSKTKNGFHTRQRWRQSGQFRALEISDISHHMKIGALLNLANRNTKSKDRGNGRPNEAWLISFTKLSEKLSTLDV